MDSSISPRSRGSSEIVSAFDPARRRTSPPETAHTSQRILRHDHVGRELREQLAASTAYSGRPSARAARTAPSMALAIAEVSIREAETTGADCTSLGYVHSCERPKPELIGEPECAAMISVALGTRDTMRTQAA